MKIEKRTFDFLNKLKENNNREWFTLNKEEYQFALNNVRELIKVIILRLSAIDPHIQ